MNFERTDMLLSRRKPKLKCEHFPYFILDDFAPSGLFEKLEAEFPRYEEMSGSHQHGKVFVNNRDLVGREDAFFEYRPAWREVIDFLGSPEFVEDFSRLVRPGLVPHRYLGAFRKWRLDTQRKHTPLIERPIQLTYEFSGMPADSFINPHTDKATKLANFIWHFPERRWRDQDRGGTLFMTAKRRKHNVNWANFKLPFEELEILDSSETKPNRLVMFAKTGNSWHAVPKIQCADGVYRRVFIFNYRMPVERTGTLPVRALESYYRRSEGWRFRDFPDVNRKPEA